MGARTQNHYLETVAPREAMALMRHTDMRLTMSGYTDPRIFDLAGGVALPTFPVGGSQTQSAKATGTHDTTAAAVGCSESVSSQQAGIGFGRKALAEWAHPADRR